MTTQRCVACRRRLDRSPDQVASERPARELTCPSCGRATVVADVGWADRLAAGIDVRPAESDEDAPSMERRISAELPLDPLTSATLIVAQENKRISD